MLSDHFTDGNVCWPDLGQEGEDGGAQLLTRLGVEDTLYSVLSVLLSP